MSVNNELEKKIINLIDIFNNQSFDEVIKQATKLYKFNNISILPNLIGASYAGKTEHKKAIIFYEKALQIDPKNIEILNNLGKSQINLKLYTKALKSFNVSLGLDKNNHDTHFNLGIAYFELGKFDESIRHYFCAIKLNEKIDKFYYNLGIVYSKIGKNKQAIDYFKKSLQLNKKNIKALNYLASQYISENKYELAATYLNDAIAINPKYAKAYNNLGALYLQKNNYKLALKNFENAYALDNQLIMSGIQKHFLKRFFCDWSENEELQSILIDTINSDVKVSPWFCLAMEDNRENHFIRAKNFSSKFNLIKKNNHIFSNKKIRVGYYAADFHQHAGMINMEGIFKNHNKNEFEIIAFYYGDIKKDSTHQRIKKYFDNFFYVNDMDDEEILKLSLENKIDIAIYRAGLTINSRSSIFSHKVAPIQVNFLGYPGTTGQEGIDYIISDRFVIPENHENSYSENIIFLTECYYPRDNNRKISQKKFSREDYNIPKDSFVFCSFNNSYKITKEEFDIWLNLLCEVKNSTLLLLVSDENTKFNLLEEVSKKNINSDRIIFLKKISLEDHLSRHVLADLFLDSFNYNAHTSAVDALWAGLPILTKVGSSFSSRICGSLLKYFKIDELIAETKDEYFKKALDLATNSEKYKKIKDQIVNTKVSENYFDTKRYTQNLEKAYKKIHQMRVYENKFSNIFIDDN